VHQGAQVICLQELCNSPYFCQVEDKAWFSLAEPVPNGPTVQTFKAAAKELSVVLIVPLFEEDGGSFYNTAVIIDADGTILGKYRKVHIPHGDGFFEKYYFKPGNLGYPVFETAVGTIGVYICSDRHFPEGARELGIAGAEIVFIPSATAGTSSLIWGLEQRAHAVANGYFVGTLNRVGHEALGDHEFYGQSYFCDPLGRILAQAGSKNEVLIADLDLALIRETRINLPFWRDRRPDTYAALALP
jgi:beta-ureidopropionase